MTIAAEKIRRFNQPATITLSGNRTLTEADLLADVITFEGSPGANCTVTAPKIEGGVWLIRNATTGGYTVTFGDAVLQSGQSAFLVCLDGAFETFSPATVGGLTFPTTIGERIKGNLITGVWESGKDGPSTDTMFVENVPQATVATASFIDVTFDGSAGSWQITLPQASTLPYGRRLTYVCRGVARFRQLEFFPFAGDRLNGAGAGIVTITSSTPATDSAYLFAEFVHAVDGWTSAVVKAVDDLGVASVVSLTLDAP